MNPNGFRGNTPVNVCKARLGQAKAEVYRVARLLTLLPDDHPRYARLIKDLAYTKSQVELAKERLVAVEGEGSR